MRSGQGPRLDHSSRAIGRLMDASDQPRLSGELAQALKMKEAAE
jgi:hypothetical protein